MDPRTNRRSAGFAFSIPVLKVSVKRSLTVDRRVTNEKGYSLYRFVVINFIALIYISQSSFIQSALSRQDIVN